MIYLCPGFMNFKAWQAQDGAILTVLMDFYFLCMK
jgi:hypothetical protein